MALLDKLNRRSPNNEMSFVDHLESLRWHIMRSVAVWILFVIIVFVNRDWVYDYVILAPTKANFVTYTVLCKLSHFLHLGEALCMPPIKMQLQGTAVNSMFMSALSIAFIGGLIVAFPYILWEFWRFIKPALSPREIKYSKGSIFWASMCFILGISFGFFILAPFTFNFLSNFTLGKITTINYNPTINDYIDTLTSLLLSCGIAFELPILVYILSKIGIVSSYLLKNIRRYAILIIFIAAAIITPSPDVSSQLIVAIPLLLLFEISIVLASNVDKQKAKEERKNWG